MRKYEKIETIFSRDATGSKKLLPGVFRNPTIEFLAPCKWIWTEKVDGTNIRVIWDGCEVSFRGRTDKAQIPPDLLDRLEELFCGEINAQMFEELFGEREVILFGEGYGYKIQKNGDKYIHDSVDFILFDVLVGDNYAARDFVEYTAQVFGIKAVPIIGRGSLFDAVEWVKTGQKSIVAQSDCLMEGIVCRPEIELRDCCGERIIVKIKYCDMKELIDAHEEG